MTFWLIFLVIVGFWKPCKLAAMLVYHQGASIWRHHTIYFAHSVYSAAYISVENYLIWLKFGQVSRFFVLFQKNTILI